MIVWALFDNGNGCYKRSADEFEETRNRGIGMKKFIENAGTVILLGGFATLFIAVIYRTVRWVLGF